MSQVVFTEQATPATPSADRYALYFKSDGKLYYLNDAGVETAVGTTAGTVTSVAQSFTGGLISVSGSPVTGSGTLALTVAGTSGGVPYFSGASTWASSAALAQYGVVLGGGAGAAPATLAAAAANKVLTANGTGANPSWQYSYLPQNSQSAAYTTTITDSAGHILHPTADNNARTFTIDSNDNVAYPIGTAITFVNQINTVTIAITSDTLVLAGAGTTGSRTLAANGMATALKIATTTWIISGTGLT
jgi:hypothetical protein